MRRLGHDFDDLTKDFAATAQIMKDHCDVVAVQEVMQIDGGAVPGHDALLDALGFSWSGIVTADPRPNTDSSNAERYAFYWRESVAHLCDGWKDGAKYIADESDVFLREPAFTCLRVRNHDRDILLASYHAIFGEPDERKREVARVDDSRSVGAKKETIVSSLRAARGDADVILLGDFNLTPPELAIALPTFKDMTIGTGSTINISNDITDNLYDHVLLAEDEPLLATLEPAEVLDVRSFSTKETFVRVVSDHLPIRFVLRE